MRKSKMSSITVITSAILFIVAAIGFIITLGKIEDNTVASAISLLAMLIASAMLFALSTRDYQDKKEKAE